MKVSGIKCPSCGVIVYSRARHDCAYCPCEAVYVDGGQDNMDWRVGYTGKPPETVKVDVDATLGELYADWNVGTDKFGLIFPAEISA